MENHHVKGKAMGRLTIHTIDIHQYFDYYKHIWCFLKMRDPSVTMVVSCCFNTTSHGHP